MSREATMFDTRDLTTAISRAGTGLLLLVAGWHQASSRLLLVDQTPWLALAASGTLVAAAAGVMWILRLRRSVADRVAAIRSVIETIPAASQAVERNDAVVALREVSSMLYHRAGCALVGGRRVRLLDVDDRFDLVPCGACIDV